MVWWFDVQFCYGSLAMMHIMRVSQSKRPPLGRVSSYQVCPWHWPRIGNEIMVKSKIGQDMNHGVEWFWYPILLVKNEAWPLQWLIDCHGSIKLQPNFHLQMQQKRPGTGWNGFARVRTHIISSSTSRIVGPHPKCLTICLCCSYSWLSS